MELLMGTVPVFRLNARMPKGRPTEMRLLLGTSKRCYRQSWHSVGWYFDHISFRSLTGQLENIKGVDLLTDFEWRVVGRRKLVWLTESHSQRGAYQDFPRGHGKARGSASWGSYRQKIWFRGIYFRQSSFWVSCIRNRINRNKIE